MIINDEPWKIDVDLIGTKEYYRKNDDCLDKEVNLNFINILSKQQMEFFENLGVDIEKIKIDCHHLEEDCSSNDTEKKEIYEAAFLVCGKLLSLIPFQAEVYSSEEAFGKDILNEVDIVETAGISNIDGMEYVFKHPSTSFAEKNLETWDCGFVCGKARLKTCKELGGK